MTLFMWDELIVLWQSGNFRAAHDWINNHWSQIVQSSVEGDSAPFAQFLQGLAYAALAFHFAGEQNQESAEIFIEDGLQVLSRYEPSFAGIETSPIIDALAELRDLLPAPETRQVIPHVASAVHALRFFPGSQI